MYNTFTKFIEEHDRKLKAKQQLENEKKQFQLSIMGAEVGNYVIWAKSHGQTRQQQQNHLKMIKTV